VSQYTEIVIKRLNGLIETANPDILWEQEAKAEMQKAVRLLEPNAPALPALEPPRA
jgi:hypothetical protein